MNWTENYFQGRENFFIKDKNKAELIWLWNHHYKMICEIIVNKNYVDFDLNWLKTEDLNTTKLNEHKIIEYKLEDSYKGNDDLKSGEEKKKYYFL